MSIKVTNDHVKIPNSEVAMKPNIYFKSPLKLEKELKN